MVRMVPPFVGADTGVMPSIKGTVTDRSTMKSLKVCDDHHMLLTVAVRLVVKAAIAIEYALQTQHPMRSNHKQAIAL